MYGFSGWNISLWLESFSLFSHLTSLGSSLICVMPCLDSSYIAVSIFSLCIASSFVTSISAGSSDLLFQTRNGSKHPGHLNEKEWRIIASKNSPGTY